MYIGTPHYIGPNAPPARNNHFNNTEKKERKVSTNLNIPFLSNDILLLISLVSFFFVYLYIKN